MISIFVMAGCASAFHGPINSPEYSELIEEALPPESGKVVMSDSGSWFPNTQGFNDIRSGRSSIFSPTSIPGIIVITDKEILFQQWNKNENNYKIMLRISFVDIQSLSLDEWGINRRIVIQKRDYTLSSFDFTTGKGQIVSKSKVEHAYNLLKQHIGK